MGYQNVLTVLGASSSQDEGYGGVISSLADLGRGVYGTVRQGQEAKAVAAKDAVLLAAASVADQRAAEAEGTATFLEGVAQASRAAQDAQRASAARQAAAIAAQASAMAGVGLSPDGQQKRLEAANAFAARKADESLAAADASSNAPDDNGKRAAMSRAAAIASAAALIAARIGGMPPGGARTTSRSPAPGENFLMRKVGPLPVYGWAGAVAVLGVGVKMYLDRRRGHIA